MTQTTKTGKKGARGHILETLEQRIREGTYGPGTWLPTERSLSSEFAADRSVVRAALDHLVQAGLIEREHGRRPRVRFLERSAVVEDGDRKQSAVVRTIAVVLPQHEADRASQEILRGLTNTLRSQPTAYRVLMFDTNLRTASRSMLEAEARKAVEYENIAGAVVWSTLEDDAVSKWQKVAELGRPVVFVDRYDDAVPCDFVGIDNYAAAREATEYLLGLGHRRIAHITTDESASSVLERAAGYRDALHAAGIVGEPVAPWVIPLGTTNAWLKDFVAHCVRTPEPPTAIFAINDSLAHRLIAQLEAHGIRVPEHMSVMGFDDEDRYSSRPALLTTVRQPFERIGQYAANLLLRRFTTMAHAPSIYQHILLPTLLIERCTCLPLRQL